MGGDTVMEYGHRRMTLSDLSFFVVVTCFRRLWGGSKPPQVVELVQQQRLVLAVVTRELCQLASYVVGDGEEKR